MKRITLSLIFISLAVPAFARVGVINLGPAYYEITTEIETPHIKWAKPLAGGPLRVLVIAPRRAQRETVELWQRIQMDYVAVGTEETGVLGATYDPNGPIGGTLPEVEARLREAVKKEYDVIITSGVFWKTLPADVFSSLVNKVKAGTGLILLQTEDKPEGAVNEFFNSFQETSRPSWILAGSRLDELPYYRKGEKEQVGPPEKVFSCYQVEKGKAARVKTGGSSWTYLVPDVGDTPGATNLDFEDQMAFVTKLILWASGRTPVASVKTLTLAATGKIMSLELEGAENAAGKALCRLNLRDQWNTVLGTLTESIDLAPGSKKLDISLPLIKAGKHRAEMQLLNENKEVFWWGVCPLNLDPQVRIKKLALLSDEVLPGTPAKGMVELTGDPSAGAKLVFKVTDAYGRVVYLAEEPARSGSFTVLDSRPLSLYHEVSVILMMGAQVLDEVRTRFSTPIKGPGWDDFSFLFWHHSTEGILGRLVNRELSRKYLADSLNCAAWQTAKRMEDILWCLAEDGLWATPYATHFGNYWGHDVYRGPCLSSPDLIKEKTTHTREVGKRLKKFCPPGYNLGDENVLEGGDRDVCFCKDCQASFREYLKVMYKDIKQLNQEWGTTFISWSEVSPITKKDALEKNQVPRWVDHRMHMNSIFVNIHRLCRDAVRESDGTARVGFEGPVGQAGYNGHDLWKFSKFMDFWGPYPFARDWYDAPRSFCPKGYYGGVWFGGYPDIRYYFHHRSWPWTAVLSGFSSVWWFSTFSGSYFDALAPDLRPYDDFLEGMKEIRRLKSGVGKLLMHTKADYSPVAIHYSIESLYAALAYGTPVGASCSSYAFSLALDEAGLSYRLIAPEQICMGQLEKYRVLILPASQALSDDETAAIRKFVESGGLLIADVRPGITDEHGKMRTLGSLDALFGVKQNFSLVGKKSEGREASLTEGPLGKVDKLSLDLSIVLDPAAQDVSASKVGNVPYFIVRKIGKGKAILLNFTPRYGLGLGKVLTPFFAEARTKPRILLEDDKGKRISNPLPYCDGEAYTIVTSAQGPSAQTVKLPSPAHCYLADENRYLGFTDKPVIEVDHKLWMRVLVCLPYAVSKLNITRSSGSKAREHKFNLSLNAGRNKPGYHVIHISVLDPEGKERPCYSANVSAPRGSADYYLPLAINDPQGRWTIVASDVATGIQVKSEFQG